MLDFELKDVRFENHYQILNWQHVQHKDFFVFFKPEEGGDKYGFKFMSLQIIGKEIDKPLLYAENIVEILYWGWAFFDGIRHLYLGHEDTENYGYINYPHINDHIKILQILRELEEKYCRDLD